MKHFSETYFFCYRHTHTYIYIVCSYYQPSLLWSQPLMENTQVLLLELDNIFLPNSVENMSSLDKTFQLIIKLFLTKTPLPVISLELANCLHIFVCFPQSKKIFAVSTPTLTRILPVCQTVVLAVSSGEGRGRGGDVWLIKQCNRVGWNITKY